MTSRLIYLLQCMGPRAVRTSTAANSWANVSLWRRFFEERELEEEEELEIIADTLVNLHFENDHGDENMRPIDREEARQARHDFVRDYYRHLSLHQGPIITSNSSRRGPVPDPVVDRLQLVATGAREAQREQRQLNQPNLDVPMGQDYVYRAQ